MQIGSNARISRTRKIGLSLNNEVINTVEQFKYLGMHLDCNLKFHDHIDKLVDQRLSLCAKP